MKPLQLTTAAALTLMAGSVHAEVISVATSTQLSDAIGKAKAGDVLLLADGTYDSKGFSCSATGTETAPIVVRSVTPFGAKVRFDALEGFKVTGAHWQFEGLDVRGVCANDSDCEHAFHVMGGADGFVLRQNRIVDFNAQLKVNALKNGSGVWVMPKAGLIEGNELFDTRARNTSNPTTKLNIDTGDDWILRGNFLHDFQKGGGDNVSYGAFLKSGGKRGLLERNLVLCARDTTGGTRIGLSFGGGGTAPQFCAPAFDAASPCAVEHEDGVMRNNIIASCSDVGIYLNRAKNTKLLHNTLIATSGIDFRFATTTGEARANVLTGSIRMRDGGTFTGVDNLQSIPESEFVAMYLDPLKGDLRKKGDLAKLIDKATATRVTDDYCARTRTGTHDLGALEHSRGDCVTSFPPSGGMTPGTDAGVTDSGSPSDGGVVVPGSDSAVPADGSNGSASDAESSGCGCRTTRATTSAGWWLVVALAWTLRQRRLKSRRRIAPGLKSGAPTARRSPPGWGGTARNSERGDREAASYGLARRL